MGDPAGVGPEIVVKALAKKDVYQHEYVVYGAADILQYYNEMLKLGLNIHPINDLSEYLSGAVNVIDSCGLKMEEYEIGQLSAKCGDAAYQYIERSIKDAMDGKIQAVVTGPLNKEALHMGGHHFDGHTEIFAQLTGTKTYAMMFYGPLKIMHVSTHCSLMEACRRATKERVLDVIRLLNDALKQTGLDRPHIAVAGLNPHAGEHGLFGTEEIKEIGPAIEAAKEEGIYVDGPVPPDSVFNKTLNGVYDAAVAMYHDQGHIAAKLEHMSQCVNCTIGLPIIRTSVDHGTAFDIAGKGIADGENMKQSMLVAEEFMKNR
ncbi:MAG: 4-hydroxythreonine-4-phosphate dehydrogenase PdxA [Blautia sp.]